MKVKNILKEALFSNYLIDYYKKDPRYEYISQGRDAIVLLEKKTGFIIKIIGYSPSDIDIEAIKVFVDYCEKHKTNKMLPQFFDVDDFQYENKNYLRIVSERLFPIEFSLGMQLSNLTRKLIRKYDEHHNKAQLKQDVIDYVNSVNDDFSSQITGELLSQIDIDVFIQTLVDLVELSDKHDFMLDLHSANFMHGGDGEIVFNDPWVNI